MKRIAGVLAFFFLLLLPLASWGQERILVFSSTATVNADSSLEVREDITVHVEGRQIRRGIYRDFPTRYTAPSGRAVRAGFTVKETLLNGRPVPYRTESIENGVRVYLGDPKSTAPLGEQTYTLTYTTTRMVGFFDEHDELYWNVTGNDWAFPIDEARFSLSIPDNTPFDSVEFFTGWRGARWRNAQVLPDDSVVTTIPLRRGEGLTVVYTWPKGVVTAPRVPLSIRFFDRFVIHFLVAMPILLFLAYLLLWLRWGKDPPMPIIIPLFSPSAGRTPGFLRYIRRMRMDNTCFTAEILNLAVKGYIVIEEHGADTRGATGLLGGLTARLKRTSYSLKRTDKPAPAAPGAERTLLSALFPYGRKELFLGQENHSTLGHGQGLLAQLYKKRGEDLFSKNTLIWLSGLLVPFFGWLMMLLLGRQEELTAASAVFTIALTVAAFLMKSSVVNMKEVRGFGKLLVRSFLPGIIALLLFSGIFALFGLELAFIPLVSLAMAVLIVVFHDLMTIRTPKGNIVLAEAEGLAMYMATAERHRLERFNPPEETPEVFETLFPYAFALGVAETWANRFEKILKEQQYQPAWYSGSNIGLFSTGSGIASMTSAVSGSIASASVAPGSSSGSGGGGFSGGGGGGGGGGGW